MLPNDTNELAIDDVATQTSEKYHTEWEKPGVKIMYFMILFTLKLRKDQCNLLWQKPDQWVLVPSTGAEESIDWEDAGKDFWSEGSILSLVLGCGDMTLYIYQDSLKCAS